MTPTAVLLAQAVALSSSGLFAGFTWALSDAALPGVLDDTEETLCRQWRYQYLRGFYAAVTATPLNVLCWGFLAFHAEGRFLRQLFGLAAATTGSGTVFAWTALRGINGALSIRAEKVAGPGPNAKHISLTYSRDEAWAKGVEAKSSTRELVLEWIRLNNLRSGILVVGTVIGALGVALSK